MEMKKLKELECVCSINEVAEAIGTGPNNLRQQIRNGTIPERFYKRIGNAYAFHVSYIKWHKLNKQKINA